MDVKFELNELDESRPPVYRLSTYINHVLVGEFHGMALDGAILLIDWRKVGPSARRPGREARFSDCRTRNERVVERRSMKLAKQCSVRHDRAVKGCRLACQLGPWCRRPESGSQTGA